MHPVHLITLLHVARHAVAPQGLKFSINNTNHR